MVVDRFSDAIIENPKLQENPALREWNESGQLAGLKFMRTLWLCHEAGAPFQYTGKELGEAPGRALGEGSETGTPADLPEWPNACRKGREADRRCSGTWGRCDVYSRLAARWSSWLCWSRSTASGATVRSLCGWTTRKLGHT
jgi:hypothetical protein